MNHCYNISLIIQYNQKTQTQTKDQRIFLCIGTMCNWTMSLANHSNKFYERNMSATFNKTWFICDLNVPSPKNNSSGWCSGWKPILNASSLYKHDINAPSDKIRHVYPIAFMRGIFARYVTIFILGVFSYRYSRTSSIRAYIYNWNHSAITKYKYPFSRATHSLARWIAQPMSL